MAAPLSERKALLALASNKSPSCTTNIFGWHWFQSLIMSIALYRVTGK